MVSEPVPESALMMLVILVWNVCGEGEEIHSAYLLREPSYEQ